MILSLVFDLLGIYYMSIFWMLVKVKIFLESLRAKLFSEQGEDTQKVSWVK